MMVVNRLTLDAPRSDDASRTDLGTRSKEVYTATNTKGMATVISVRNTVNLV
jgi:hypothetical protein